MKIIRFKKDMAFLVRERKKRATTRYSIHDLGMYQAVEGSRYKPSKFGELHIYEVTRTTWYQVINYNHLEEGFASPKEMLEYLLKQKLIKTNIEDIVYLHRFDWIG